MAQTFRLRLGDGTVLRVDHGGLSTWESDPTAAIGTRDPRKWIPLKEFLVQERAAALRRAREGSAAGSGPVAPEPAPPAREDGLPLVPPPPREGEEDHLDLPSAPDGEASLPAPPEEVTSLELPASGEEPKPASAAVPEALFVPEDPPPRVTASSPRESTLPERAETALPAAPIAEEIDLEPLAAEAMGPSAVAPPPAPIEELPVIPLRPLGDEAPPSAPDLPEPTALSEAPTDVLSLADEPTAGAGRPLRDRRSNEDPELGEPVRLPGLVTAALQWSAVLGAILSRGLAPLTRLDQGLPLFGVDDPTVAFEPHASPSGEISLPTMALDFGVARERVLAILRGLPDRTRGWLDGATSRISGFAAHRIRREPPPAASADFVTVPAPEEEGPEALTGVAPAPDASASLAPAAPRPRVQRAPPPLAELPALRLATPSEPRVVGDVYAGDGGGGLRAWVGLWARRLLVTATVLGAGTLAGLRWDSWSPAAGRMGWTLFNEIDDEIRWLHLARERQEVIEQASEQLPHLTRDTVGLILSTNRTHVLEPPVVFETAWGAAQRGASTLTASEAAELEALRLEIVDALPPLDRERLRAFDAAYARGAVFPFDARRGLLSYARGARSLPPEHRERLQTLLGKAIAAGLET